MLNNVELRGGGTMAARTAVLLGASGLVGGHCLRELLVAGDYGRVIAIVRRNLSLASNQSHIEKLEQRVVDLSSVSPDDFAGVNDVFCALGTTIAKAGSQSAFRAVDYEMPMRAARAAKEAGVEQFLLVSSIGANPETSNFYLRTKGELERDLATIGFKALHIFRPGLLLGSRQEFRFSEAIAQRIGPFLNAAMWGPLRRYRSIRAERVAKAMVGAALRGGYGVMIYQYDEMMKMRRE
jgi:uncharacterized protein YbjT (DUF2867 family)